MPSDPKANPDVMHVDGPTGYDSKESCTHCTEPRCDDDERFTIYYCPKCGGHKCDPGDMVIHSRDCGGTYDPIEVVRVSAEPSPDPLLEALRLAHKAIELTMATTAVKAPSAQDALRRYWKHHREALATDQSQSDPDALREAARQLLGQVMVAESVDDLVPYLKALEDAAGFCQQGQPSRSDRTKVHCDGRKPPCLCSQCQDDFS